MSQFALDIQKWVNKTKGRASDFVGLVVIGVAQELDSRSPVGDAKYWKHPAPKGYVGGHFRANWQLGVDARPAGVVPGVNYGVTVGKAIGELPGGDGNAGHVYYLANNVPYAQRLEEGHSRQAPPNFIVAGTVSTAPKIVRRALAQVPE